MLRFILLISLVAFLNCNSENNPFPSKKEEKKKVNENKAMCVVLTRSYGLKDIDTVFILSEACTNYLNAKDKVSSYD